MVQPDSHSYQPDTLISIGQTGKVLAMVTQDGRAEYLVKWKGRAWPCVVWLTEIEEVT